MKLYNFLAIGCLALATAFNNAKASDASSSSDPYTEFTTAGFKLLPLNEIPVRTDFFEEKSVAALKGFFKEAANVAVVVSHPFADGKTIRNYAPPRSTYAPPRSTVEVSDKLVPFDTTVMSRYANGQLSDILISWVNQGFSSHVILTANGIVFWVDPFKCKGQMAGTWNQHSLEVLAETDVLQSLSAIQIDGLAALMALMKTHDESIVYLLSYGEARDCGTEGTIANIGEARRRLELYNANKAHDQTALISAASTTQQEQRTSSANSGAQVEDEKKKSKESSSWLSCAVQ